MPDETPAPSPVPAPTPAAPAPASAAPPAAVPAPAPQKPRDEGIVGLLKLAPIVLVGVALGVWFLRPASPTARVEGELARARVAVQEGRWLDATPILERIARDRTLPDDSLRTQAAAELATLATRAVDEKRPLGEVEAILGAELETLEGGGAAEVGSGTLSGTVARALDRVVAETPKDPKGASELAERLIPLVEGSELEPRARDARTKALDAEIARDPKDVEALAARASIELAEGKVDEARARLEPVSDKLGGGEGARVLGLVRLRAGQIDESVAYLSSYFEANLPALDRADEGLTAALERAVRGAELEPALALKYREVHGDAAKQRVHDDFVRERVRTDAAVRGSRHALVHLSPMLEVGILIAQIEITKGRGKSAGERESRLDRANRALFGVRVLGIDTDTWWVWVARLKVEEGKTADVETMISSYLERRGHGYTTLYLAAELLCEAGDLGPARARAEEAFAAATKDADKQVAAALRARVADSAEEQVTWLERAGSRPETAALISQARASLALAEGRFDDAAAAYDAALRFYESEAGAGEASPVHTALLVLAKSEATGQAADLDRAIERLEALVKDEPAPLVALDALADALQARAVATVVGARVDSSLLRDRSLELVDFAAADEKDAAALAEAFAANPDLGRSRALRERCTVETPHRARPYGSLIPLAWRTRDADRLEALVTRIARAELDRTEEVRELQELWSGKRDEAQRRALAPRRKRADAVLALARASGKAATIAQALGTRSALEREASALGAEADHDLAVQLATEAHTLAPRRSTRLELRNALLARAAQALRKESPAFDGLVAKYGKVGLVTILTWAVRDGTVRGDAPLAAKLARNPDVKRALDLHAEACAPGAGEPHSNDVRLFAIAADPRGADAAARIKASRLLLGTARANAALFPESPDVVNELLNVFEARGDVGERARALRQARLGQGVSVLPHVPKNVHGGPDPGELDPGPEAPVPLPYELLEK